jgi:hypothetical protein
MRVDNLYRGKVSKREGYLCFFVLLIEVILYMIVDEASILKDTARPPLPPPSPLSPDLVNPYSKKITKYK